MHLRFASIVICTTAVALMACSSSPTPNTGTDTGSEEDTSTEQDTATEDTGSEDSGGGDSTLTDTGTTGETSITDSSADTKEVSTKCTTPGSTETEDCGKCGTRARLCDSDLTWLPWGLCTGETGACVAGETRSVKCGKCGTRMETCTAMCAWDPMACTGEGLCNAGDMEIQYGACSNPTYVKTRTCSTTTCAWGDFSGCIPPKGWIDTATTSISGRYYHTAVWTGTEMIVWGGYNGSYFADGAAYNPSANTWRTIAAAPIAARYYHTAVWTGTKMIVWGGTGSTSYFANGAVYDPSLDSWSLVSATGAPTGRYYHSAVWSGTEMIVWGGYTPSYAADGYAYNPTSNSWRTIATSPLVGRRQHGAAFANGKMVIFGGSGSSSSYLGDAASWDAASDSWTMLTPPSSDLDGRYYVMGAVDPTKKQIAFWGGYGTYTLSSYYKGTGGVFDTATSTWKSITLPAESVLPYPRRYMAATWWAPDGLYVWGGYGAVSTTSTSNAYNDSGAIWDPTTSTWRAMSASNAPAGRYGHTAVWTGAEAIIWGGYNSSGSYRNDGKIYRP